jgi:formimidoylglutamate deiminase
VKSFLFDHALLPGGWAREVRIDVADGMIVAVQQSSLPGDAERIAGVALPGLPNLHCHAFQRAMAGLAEGRGPAGDSFWTWREVMYGFLAHLTPGDLEAIAAFAYMEMLESGFTAVGEFHYLHHDVDGRPFADLGEMATRIAAAAAQTGIGLTLLPSFYANGGFGGMAGTHAQRRFLNDPDVFLKLLARTREIAADLPDAAVGVAPHSLRAVTPPTLRRVVEACGAGPIHIHVSEQKKEVEDSLAAFGRRPVAWLLENYEIGPRWCLIHATHMDDAETASPVPAPLRACVRSPRPISVTVFFPPNRFSPAAAGLGSVPIPTSRSRRRRSCASLNMPSACSTTPAMSSPVMPATRPDGASMMRR